MHHKVSKTVLKQRKKTRVSKSRSLRDMKLLIIPSGLFASDGKQFLCNNLLGRHIEQLSSYFGSAIICASVVTKDYKEFDSIASYSFSSENIDFCVLPENPPGNPGVLKTLAKLIRQGRVLFSKLRNCDLVYISLPSNVGIISFLSVKFWAKPFFLYIGGDMGEVSHYVYRWNKGIGKVFYSAFILSRRFLGAFIKLMVKHSLFSLVRGAKLHNIYYVKDKVF